MAEDPSKRLAVLEFVIGLNAKLRDIRTDQEVFSIIANELKHVTGADLAALVLVEKGGSQLKVVSGIDGLVPTPLIEADLNLRKMWTDKTRSTVFRFDSQAEIPESLRSVPKALGLERMLGCAIMLRGEFLGYLLVGNKMATGPFSKDTEDFIAAMAEDIPIVIENVRASLELRHAKEEADHVLTLAPVGIFTCDSKGIFTSVNKQMKTLFDVPSGTDLLRTSVFELPVISKAGLDALIMSGMEGHEGEKADVHMVPRSDKAFYLHVKVAPIKSEEGAMEGVLFVAMDITSKVRLQNQLERSYEKLTQTYQELERVTKMKTQFIDIVSHELRTPLTVMRGYIDLVESEYTPKLEPKFASRLKIIKANTDKLYALVESMLDVSRLEKGSLQIHPEPVNIDAILAEIVDGRKHDAEMKKQTLLLDVEGRLPLIMADRRRLKDVFSNIVDNALKYTQEGGRVQVSARDEGRMIHVWIKDNGVGIPLEALGRIFDRFHIVTSNDLSHQVDRLGLGLPIAKGIIEAHQGRIWVESQVGKGSVFHIDLPKEPPG